MDRLTGLAVFVRVVDDKSFAAAARHFNLSPASVSAHVRDLEERLGARLLNRTTRSVSPTDVGRAFYDRTRQILADLENAEKTAGALQTEPRGVLRLNTMPSFAAAHLVPAIYDFIRRYPQVSVELSVTGHTPDLVEEGIDLAVRCADTASDSRLISRRLAPIRIVVAGTAAYFATQGKPEKPADLATHNCLTLMGSDHAGEWRFTNADGSDQRVVVKGNLQSNIAEVLRVAALQGQGLVRLPSYLIGDDLRAGRLVPVLCSFAFRDDSIVAFFPHSRLMAAKTRGFIDFLVARFGPEPYWDDWNASLAAE